MDNLKFPRLDRANAGPCQKDYFVVPTQSIVRYVHDFVKTIKCILECVLELVCDYLTGI